MKKIVIVFVLLPALAITFLSCVTTAETSGKMVSERSAENTQKIKPPVINSPLDIDEWGGADSYGFTGDNADSRYYKNPDYYNLSGAPNVTIIDEFETYQQTSEWSCGCCAALMVLNELGITGYTEWDIALAMGTSLDEDTAGAEPGSADNFYEFGTSVKKMYDFFKTVPGVKIVETSYVEDYSVEDLIPEGSTSFTPNSAGNLPGKISSMSLYTTENNDLSENWVDDAADSWFVMWLRSNLEAGRPIMVEWGDWDGHWQTIIGYDSNGTPGIGDDILILADSYDTSDHWQDGYYCYPLERWFYMWADRNIAPKPFQIQPYIIIDRE
ncbi:MAG: hypothetical protein JEZ04_09895 [Spirochaetales bacterium]|nr:hypothetical protein [Spirochaetales bacterium]